MSFTTFKMNANCMAAALRNYGVYFDIRIFDSFQRIRFIKSTTICEALGELIQGDVIRSPLLAALFYQCWWYCRRIRSLITAKGIIFHPL